ncbi:unnamed protein product [Discosporangium mesarthrocarpum]
MRPRDRCLVSCSLRGSTFLAGEEVSGVIKLTHQDGEEDHVMVDTVTVEAHGYVKVDPRWIKLPTSLGALFGHETDHNHKTQQAAGGGAAPVSAATR